MTPVPPFPARTAGRRRPETRRRPVRSAVAGTVRGETAFPAPLGRSPMPSPGAAGSDLGASGESGADGHARRAVVPYGTTARTGSVSAVLLAVVRVLVGSGTRPRSRRTHRLVAGGRSRTRRLRLGAVVAARRGRLLRDVPGGHLLERDGLRRLRVAVGGLGRGRREGGQRRGERGQMAGRRVVRGGD